jgi:hypothetical protein
MKTAGKGEPRTGEVFGGERAAVGDRWQVLDLFFCRF